MEYTVFNDHDENEIFTVEAEDFEGAMEEALKVLGWCVADPEDDEDWEEDDDEEGDEDDDDLPF